MESGSAWIVDAFGCDPTRLRSTEALVQVFRALVAELDLHPLRDAVWQQFPGAGGVTGFLLLTESHVACHTFPERRLATFDLYCCRPRPEWPWAARLRDLISATRVTVRRVERGIEMAGIEME
jgi:S-adenosylmethionine decarboxylase